MPADIYIGQILLVPYNFAPVGYAFCNGQLMEIAQNTALFSILGTTYGGDGKTYFGLPNLQGRVAIGEEQGPGLSDRELGEIGGEETHTLTASELPAHTHALTSTIVARMRLKNAAGNSATPVNNVNAIGSSNAPPSMSSLEADVNMRPGSIVVNGAPTAALTGSSAPHSNLAPYLTLNFVIALQGVFPPRP